MNRTDRLLAIVLELQAKGHLRAEDLAATFETSKRTIYRDMQALGEAGVPLVSSPGHGYALLEGYFLPPLSFSAEEGAVLLLGAEFIAQHFDPEYQRVATDAGRKIAGVLPDRLRKDVNSLRDSIRFIALGVQDQPVEIAALRQLRRAILTNQRIRFTYHAKSSNETTFQREADPYGLIHVAGGWHTVAYCHLRNDFRLFRLTRMEQLLVLPQPFVRDSTFEMERFLGTRRVEDEPEAIIVRVKVDHTAARWVNEQYHPLLIDRSEMPDGILITFRVRTERDVLQWILGWGSAAFVLEPESLRQLVQQEAAKVAALYQGT